VWRKLREKLSTHIADGCPHSKASGRIDKFRTESKELTEGFELPHDFNWYKSVAV